MNVEIVRDREDNVWGNSGAAGMTLSEEVNCDESERRECKDEESEACKYCW